MGGCSSKPKTAEFEGAKDMEEDKFQDEAAGKSLEMDMVACFKDIDKEQETSKPAVLSTLVEEKHKQLHNMLAETEKLIGAGFEAEGESKVERQALGNECANVQQLVDKEINGDLCHERQTIMKVGVDLKILALASSDPPVKVRDPDFKEMVVKSPMEAGVVYSTEHQFAFSIKRVDMQVRPFMSEYETSAAQKGISHDTRASHFQEKALNAQEEFMRLGGDVCTEAETNTASHESVAPKDMDLKLQKYPFEAETNTASHDSVAPKDMDLKLQKYPFEEARKLAVTLQSKEASHRNEGQQMPDSNLRQKKGIGTTEMKSQDTSNEAGKGLTELGSQKVVHDNGVKRLADNPRPKNELEDSSKGFPITANGACMLDNPSEQSGKVVLEDKSLLISKDLSAKGEANDVTNFGACPSNHQSLVVEYASSLDGGVHEERTQAKGVDEAGSTFAFLEDIARSNAESLSKGLLNVDNDPQRKSMASDDSWYILEKVEVPNMDPSTMVCEGLNHKELPKRDGYAHKVIEVPSDEKPEAQAADVLDPVGLAFKNMLAQAQEVPAPDIDDVWEKLASEFERQESLSCTKS